MYYAIDKLTRKIYGEYGTIEKLYEAMLGKEDKYLFLEDAVMKVVPRITFINNQCVYNNRKFWLENGAEIIKNFDDYVIKDILNKDIDKIRFIDEYNTICPRAAMVDGRPGQIEYNIEVGNEFISLFREECILTDFNNRSNTTPMKIFQKLEQVIGMVQIGAFREAKQFLQYYRESLLDDFLTDERIDKYITMLDAADSIEYATNEDEFVYHAPEKETEE